MSPSRFFVFVCACALLAACVCEGPEYAEAQRPGQPPQPGNPQPKQPQPPKMPQQPPFQPQPQFQPQIPQAELQKFQSIVWQEGPCTAKMRNIAQVNVPKGFKFTDETGTGTIMDLTKNLRQPADLGTLCPSHYNPFILQDDWFLVYSWSEVGYVKDDDKNSLNGDAIMQELRNGQAQANPQLAARGYPQLELVGWKQTPFYDPQTNTVSWATHIREIGRVGSDNVNYNSRLLGRGGYVSANLVIAPHLLDGELPKYKEILKATTFQPGQKYSEWRSGDKVAGYGLAALVTGGVVAAAAKSGILAKAGKLIIYAVVAVVAGIGALFKKIFGGSKSA